MNLWHQTTGAGQPLLLVHGWGMNSAVWQPVLAQLEQHYQVTLVDLPGHGDSELLPAQQTLSSWAQAVADIAPVNAIWLGWSLGGLVALQAAAEDVSMQGLLMMAATPCFAQRDTWPAAMPVKTLDQFADSLHRDVQTTLTRFLSLQVQGCENSRDLLKQLRAAFSSKPSATPSALDTGLGFLHDSDLRGELAASSLPIRFILGQKDTLVPARVAPSLAALNDALAVHIVDGAGHVPFISHTDICLQQLAMLVDDARQAA